MRIKLDENVPHRLVEPLTQFGHEAPSALLDRLARARLPPDSGRCLALPKAAHQLRPSGD
jgi:hypothetical protein